MQCNTNVIYPVNHHIVVIWYDVFDFVQQAPLLLGKESSSDEGGSVADGEESNEDSELSESEFESTGSSNRDSLLHGGSPSPSNGP